MARTITHQVMVGVTPKIKFGLENACTFLGTPESQFCRQAILEKLIREGFVRPPMLKNFEPAIEAAE